MCNRSEVKQENCHQEVTAEFTVKISRISNDHRALLQLLERRLHLSAFVRRMGHGAEGDPFIPLQRCARL